MFYDQTLYREEADDYMLQIHEGKEGYSIESFEERQLTFGTFLVITNMSNPAPEEVYKRMELETMFDELKNIIEADYSYMQSDESFKA